MRELVEVADGVLVTTSPRSVTNTTLVLDGGGGCLVVDPAVTAVELESLAQAIAQRDLRVVAGWSTHPHWDHVLWSASLGTVPRWATQKGAEVAAAEHAGLVEGADSSAPGHDLELLGLLDGIEPGTPSVPWDGPSILVLEHGGHAPGHGALLVQASEGLIAGDMCSDIEVPLLDLDADDPIGAYRSGIELLARAAAAAVQVVVPGHGAVGDEAEMSRRFELDQRYLDDLEAGRDPPDPRLETAPAWLRDEHARQVAWQRDRR